MPSAFCGGQFFQDLYSFQFAVLFNYILINYNPINYNPINYNPINYKPINYNPINYKPINYNLINYIPFNPVSWILIFYGTDRTEDFIFGSSNAK